MSNSVIRHYPNFVDVEKDKTKYKFDSYEELLEIEWIKKISESDNFVGFFVSDGDTISPLLMSKLVSSYWVIGYLENSEYLEKFTKEVEEDISDSPKERKIINSIVKFHSKSGEFIELYDKVNQCFDMDKLMFYYNNNIEDINRFLKETSC